MSPRTSGRRPEASTSTLLADDRRGWLSHGLAALAVSALGLVVAGSMAVSTSAETTSGSVGTGAGVTRPAPPLPDLVPGTGGRTQQRPTASAVTYTGALRAFVPASADDDQTPDDRVRAAVVEERAAQRAEDLSKTAEDATRVTRTADQAARSGTLAATDREIRETAVRIATERRQRATALRVAAEVARRNAQAAAAQAAADAQAAQQASTTTTTTPSTTTPSTTTGTTPPSGTVSSGGAGFSPVPGAVIGTPFGATGLWARYHTGLDFRAAQGTPIRAVSSGVVLYAGNSGNWAGNHVAIIHADGITTMSSHMSSMSVRAGETVRAGQVIGRVGQTGRAFGAHLHFEVYPRGVRYGDIYKAVNPIPWLRSKGVSTH